MLGCQVSSSGSDAANNSDAMDQALEMLTGLEPFANHGPMAAEALVSLGRVDSIVPFVNAYKKRFSLPYPSSYQSVTSANWREALGDQRRVADWANFGDSVKGQSLYIALTKFLGTFVAFILAIRWSPAFGTAVVDHRLRAPTPMQPLIYWIYPLILVFDVLYIRLVYQKCIDEGINPWRR